MNYGAYVINANFLNAEEILQLKELSLKLLREATPTHAAGTKYASNLWSYIPLVNKSGEAASNVDIPAMRKVLDFFQTSITLGVFYYLMPGGDIHPHRDLTGAKMHDRIRFHIPIQTNDEVYFHVSHERMKMLPGTLWALDTSYLHAVRNAGIEPRVHIVIECDVNDWCRSILAKPNLKTKMHDIYYTCYLIWAVSKSLVINSWKDPKYLKVQLNMGIDFLKWRLKGFFSGKK